MFELPSEGNGELHLKAAGNSKCHPAAVGNWIWERGSSHAGQTVRKRM